MKNTIKSNEISLNVIKTMKKLITFPYFDQSYYRVAYNLYHKDSQKYKMEVNENMEKGLYFC